MSEPPPGRPDFQPPLPPPPPPAAPPPPAHPLPPPPPPAPPVLLTRPPVPGELPELSGPVALALPLPPASAPPASLGPPPSPTAAAAAPVEEEAAETEPSVEELGAVGRVLTMALTDCMVEGYWTMYDAHLLLGLIAGDDEVSDLLRRYGVRSAKLRENWAYLKGPGTELVQSHLVTGVLRGAVRDARGRGQEISSAHVLASMLRSEHNVTIEALTDVGVDVVALRADVAELVDQLPVLPDNPPDPDFVPDPVLPARGSSCLGMVLGVIGVGLAVGAIGLVVRYRHVDVPASFWPAFHFSWALALTIVGGLAAIFRRWRRTGLGMVFLSVIGYIVALWTWLSLGG